MATPKEHKLSDLVIRVLTTANLCAVGWCDLKDRYWLVWCSGVQTGIPIQPPDHLTYWRKEDVV